MENNTMGMRPELKRLDMVFLHPEDDCAAITIHLINKTKEELLMENGTNIARGPDELTGPMENATACDSHEKENCIGNANYLYKVNDTGIMTDGWKNFSGNSTINKLQGFWIEKETVRGWTIQNDEWTNYRFGETSRDD